MNIPDRYTLPQMDFVGGSTQDLVFHCYFHIGRKPHDLSSCSANFAIVNYNHKDEEPLVSKPMTVSSDPGVDGGISNVLRVTLDPADTVDLPNGKYVYQVSIRDVSGDVEIPKHGIMHIINNINKAFAR